MLVLALAESGEYIDKRKGFKCSDESVESVGGNEKGIPGN